MELIKLDLILMRPLFIGILLIVSGSSALAQSKTDMCSFLKNLKFKNGRDTIVVKAVLYDVHMAPPRLRTKKHPTIYRYKFGSEIAFKPVNCFKEYSEPLLDKAWDEKILKGSNNGITLYLTCVVFNEHFYYNNGEPDCMIIKVSRKNPTKLK